MTLANRTTISHTLKRIWNPRGIQDLLFVESKLYGMLKKRSDWGGDALKVPIDYAPVGGASRDFTTAVANMAGSKGIAFLVDDLALDYAIGGIETLALRTAAKDPHTFANALQRESKKTFKSVTMSMNRALYNNHGGALGRIESTSGTTLTLADRTDIVNFYVGMTIVSDDTDGTSGAADAQAVEITGVNRTLGTLTKAGADWDASGNFATDDYLFREGDFGLAMRGLASWILAADPSSSDSFYGVNRSIDSTQLAGTRYTASASADGTIENALIAASVEVNINGGSPKICMMNPRAHAALIRELGAKTTWSKTPAMVGGKPHATIGYDGITVVTDLGKLVCHSDLNCPYGTAYMLDLDSLTLWSAGDPIGWLDDDGNQVLRAASTDGVEWRVGGYTQLVCDAPGHNANVNLTAVLPAI